MFSLWPSQTTPTQEKPQEQVIGPIELIQQLRQKYDNPKTFSPQDNNAFDQSLDPFKKYFLLNQLTDFEEYLKDINIVSDTIDTLVQFGHYLDYPTLVRVTSRVLEQLCKEHPVLAQTVEKTLLNQKQKSTEQVA